MRPERVSRYFACFSSWLGLIGVAIDHFDGAGDEDFPGVAGIEECVACAEGDFRLIDFDDPFEGVPVRIDHRSPQLLRQQPGGPIGEAELILQLPRRHAVGMRRHQMRGPKPSRQRQLGAVHRRARRDRGLTTAIEAFVCVRPALQRRRATLAAHRADEAIRPAPFEQKRRAARLVGKRLLEFGKRACPGHRLSRHAALTAAHQSHHTTSRATWDNGISHPRRSDASSMRS